MTSKETTARNKQAFLDNYPTFVNTRMTAKAIGLCEKTPYLWLDQDEEFNTAFTTIKREVDAHRLDEVEKEIHDRAMGGTSKQSDILLMFSAKGLAPNKWRENAQQTTIINAGSISYAHLVKLAKDKVLPLVPQVKAPLQLKEGEKEE